MLIMFRNFLIVFASALLLLGSVTLPSEVNAQRGHGARSGHTAHHATQHRRGHARRHHRVHARHRGHHRIRHRRHYVARHHRSYYPRRHYRQRFYFGSRPYRYYDNWRYYPGYYRGGYWGAGIGLLPFPGRYHRYPSEYHWQRASYGKVPYRAVVQGRRHGKSYYYCKAKYRGHFRRGTLYRGSYCLIRYGNKTRSLSRYWILVRVWR